MSFPDLSYSKRKLSFKVNPLIHEILERSHLLNSIQGEYLDYIGNCEFSYLVSSLTKTIHKLTVSHLRFVVVTPF